jgi:F0F1-type ATP synthase membrane subunit a
VIVAIPPLAAEQLFTVAGLPITNTMINSWLALGVFLVLGFLVRFVWLKNTTKLGAPKGALNFVEQLVEFILDYMDRVTGNRHRSIKFLPIIGSLFLFILTANWMGMGKVGAKAESLIYV